MACKLILCVKQIDLTCASNSLPFTLKMISTLHQIDGNVFSIDDWPAKWRRAAYSYSRVYTLSRYSVVLHWTDYYYWIICRRAQEQLAENCPLIHILHPNSATCIQIWISFSVHFDYVCVWCVCTFKINDLPRYHRYISDQSIEPIGLTCLVLLYTEYISVLYVHQWVCVVEVVSL